MTIFEPPNIGKEGVQVKNIKYIILIFK